MLRCLKQEEHAISSESCSGEILLTDHTEPVENRMTPRHQPRTLLYTYSYRPNKLICDFFIPDSYERSSYAPPHVRASPCAVAARIDLNLCKAAICDFRHQIHAFVRRRKDDKTVFEPLGTFFFRKNKKK